MFITTFVTVLNAVFQIILVAAAAGLLVRKEALTQTQIKALSNVTVSVFLPCLIVAKTVTQFDPFGFDLWWTLPLAGVLIAVTGLAGAALLFRMNPVKRHFIPLAGFQNAIYIVLPVSQIVFPDEFDRIALYCFLLVLGLTPIMWSLGKVLVTGHLDAAVTWKDFVTPPMIATLASIGVVFAGLSELVPGPVLGAVDLLGQATIPLAVFILGATLGRISLTDMPTVSDTLKVAAVKFVLVPAAAFAVMLFSGLYQSLPLFCSLIILQASSPPATNLILMVRSYGGDDQAVGSMMFIQYLLCILAMPLWLSLWQLCVA